MPSDIHNDMADYKVTAFDLTLALLGYYRHRGWVCVDEFRRADIIADTGNEIIEVEIKVTRFDLINGERKKAPKHQAYKAGRGFAIHPNKFLFCVPERLVAVALEWSKQINERYGVIGFDAETIETRVQKNDGIYWQANNYFLRVARSAKKLHDDYSGKLRWPMAQRASAKVATLMQQRFKRNINTKT